MKAKASTFLEVDIHPTEVIKLITELSIDNTNDMLELLVERLLRRINSYQYRFSSMYLKDDGWYLDDSQEPDETDLFKYRGFTEQEERIIMAKNILIQELESLL